MFQEFIEILILSAVQGISEFLPISSSAHLILVSNLYDLKSSSLLIDISLQALAGARANEIFIVGGASRVAEDSLNILYCQDMFPGEGPLGGIISALSVAEYDVLVTLPCDHLYVTSQVVEQCLAALSIHEMACPLLEDTKQVLCSAWRKSGLKKLKEIFNSGTRSVMDAVSLLDVVTFQVSNPEILRTANTIDELWQ